MVTAVLFLGGCAVGTTGVSGQDRMESLLIRAGFEIFPESDPKCQRVCQKIPPEQLVPHREDDKTVYTYFSPGSEYLYVGDEATYQRFINLAVLKSREPAKPSRMCQAINSFRGSKFPIWLPSFGIGLWARLELGEE